MAHRRRGESSGIVRQRSLSEHESFERWKALPPLLQFIVNPYDAPVWRPSRTRSTESSGSSSQLPYARRQLMPRTPVAFPYALFDIVQDPSNSEWIRWNNDGDEFQFCDWSLLIGELSRRGMAAKKKESVSKNLHDYEFASLTDSRRRIPDQDGLVWHKFRHPNFQQGRRDLISGIVRRYRR
ncbi:Heat shock transcription factor [Coemansia brasiliensis]|uniref:Heat shock transcription factor n=1 Tax=Coemansia brasiliensis TaxID=2650707 RepID=A0A9W8IJF2_9FUNG|nr:Heat shock transcription factor [Coemansia brasiliensis]